MADASVSTLFAIKPLYQKGDFGHQAAQNKNNSATHESHDAPRRIRMNELEFLNKIGRGSTSVVYAVNLGNRLAAAKKVNEVDSTEVALTKHFCHPNVIHLFGVVDEGPNAFIIMELASNGSLDKYLKSVDGDLPQDLFHDWIEQAAAAVNYLHEQGIVHRDIKSPNYLITGDKMLKLCDFGLARHLNETITTTTRGSLPWMAPEVMTDHKVSKPGDVYALATVIWEMSTGKTPYEGLDFLQIQTQVVTKSKRPEIPGGLSPHLTRLLKLCWSADRSKRPSMQEVMRTIEKVQCEAAKETRMSTSNPDEDPATSAGCLTVVGCEIDGARGISQLNDMMIAVACRSNGRVNIYDIKTGYKRFSLGEEDNYQLRDPFDVTVTPQQSFLVVEHSGSIVEFDGKGRFCRKFNLQSGTSGAGACKPLYSISTGYNGQIVVGAGNTISTLSPRGALIDVKKIGIKPRYLEVCGSRDEVVVSGDACVQVMDLYSGKVKMRRRVPIVTGVCYSEDASHLYVVQRLEPYGPGVVNKHDVTTGDFISCECRNLERPGGATLVGNGSLAVADWSSVKIFSV